MASNAKEINDVPPRQCTVPLVHKTMVKLNKLNFKMVPLQPYSSDLAPSVYWLFTELKKMLQEKRFGFYEEVIAETEDSFESKDKSLYKKGIKK